MSGYEPKAFRAAWWLRGAHRQTIGGKFLRPRMSLPLERERLETPDGDFLDLDFTARPRADAPVVLVLHGLEGSARRRYVMLTYQELLARGLHAVGLNFRSCSGEPNRLARFYHSGETGDLDHVLGVLHDRFPGVPIGVIGYSLGGNVLLRYLGERGEAAGARVHAAVGVSVPFDLTAGGEALERGIMGKVYTEYFLRSLRLKVMAKEALLAGRCDVEAVRRARTLREFDDAITAPLHGFEDAADYYRRASSAAVLEAIRVPTLLLQSEDDPFLPARHLPRDAVRRNPALVAAFTRRGGHVGFVGGALPWRPRFWAEAEAARFLQFRLLGRVE